MLSLSSEQISNHKIPPPKSQVSLQTNLCDILTSDVFCLFEAGELMLRKIVRTDEEDEGVRSLEKRISLNGNFIQTVNSQESLTQNGRNLEKFLKNATKINNRRENYHQRPENQKRYQEILTKIRSRFNDGSNSTKITYTTKKTNFDR